MSMPTCFQFQDRPGFNIKTSTTSQSVKLLFSCDETWKKLLQATLFKAPEEDEEDKWEATANLAEDQTHMAYFTFKEQH